MSLAPPRVFKESGVGGDGAALETPLSGPENAEIIMPASPCDDPMVDLEVDAFSESLLLPGVGSPPAMGVSIAPLGLASEADDSDSRISSNEKLRFRSGCE